MSITEAEHHDRDQLPSLFDTDDDEDYSIEHLVDQYKAQQRCDSHHQANTLVAAFTPSPRNTASSQPNLQQADQAVCRSHPATQTHSSICTSPAAPTDLPHASVSFAASPRQICSEQQPATPATTTPANVVRAVHAWQQGRQQQVKKQQAADTKHMPFHTADQPWPQLQSSQEHLFDNQQSNTALPDRPAVQTPASHQVQHHHFHQQEQQKQQQQVSCSHAEQAALTSLLPLQQSPQAIETRTLFSVQTINHQRAYKRISHSPKPNSSHPKQATPHTEERQPTKSNDLIDHAENAVPSEVTTFQEDHRFPDQSQSKSSQPHQSTLHGHFCSVKPRHPHHAKQLRAPSRQPLQPLEEHSTEQQQPMHIHQPLHQPTYQTLSDERAVNPASMAASGLIAASSVPVEVGQGEERAQTAVNAKPQVPVMVERFLCDQVQQLQEEQIQQVPASSQGEAPGPEFLKGVMRIVDQAQVDQLLNSEGDRFRHWVYPTLPVPREYQYELVRTALFHNTLVSLPTGLGKTLIAAVVMFNYYRWFPEGKIVFVAPTRPLVEQQLNACMQFLGGVPEDQFMLLTAECHKIRGQQWLDHRIFTCTQEILCNDLRDGICPGDQIVCLVVDECHKATGDAAIVKAVQQLKRQKVNFRILGLSASPGSTLGAIQTLLGTLSISRLGHRSMDSVDVVPYVHQKVVEMIGVSTREELALCRPPLMKLLYESMSTLWQNQVHEKKDLEDVTRSSLIQALKVYLDECQRKLRIEVLDIRTAFEKAIFLSLVSSVLTTTGASRALAVLNTLHFQHSFRFMANERACKLLRSKLAGIDEYQDPKIRKLEDILLHHFSISGSVDSSSKGSAKKKVIVFATCRKHVHLIKACLDKHPNIIQCRVFIGQRDGIKADDMGMRQKTQKEVLQRFCDGHINTLIATCIGEEGLDIPDVDLVVFYDCPASATRLVQRMGRTGRHDTGHVYVLNEGVEEKKYLAAVEKHKELQEFLKHSAKTLTFCPDSSSNSAMLPDGSNPLPVLVTFPVRIKPVQAVAACNAPDSADKTSCKAKKHHQIPLLPWLVITKQQATTDTQGNQTDHPVPGRLAPALTQHLSQHVIDNLSQHTSQSAPPGVLPHASQLAAKELSQGVSQCLSPQALQRLSQQQSSQTVSKQMQPHARNLPPLPQRKQTLAAVQEPSKQGKTASNAGAVAPLPNRSQPAATRSTDSFLKPPTGRHLHALIAPQRSRSHASVLPSGSAVGPLQPPLTGLIPGLSDAALHKERTVTDKTSTFF